MRLTRVFVDAELQGQREITLAEGPSSHLTRVLRLAEGSPLRVFDGRGGEHEALIIANGKRGVRLQIGPRHAIERESPLDITLLQGIARGERMDLIVQKATELGVTRIVPLRLSRSTVRIEADATERKRAHWQAVAISACEQSGRNRLPRIDPPQDLEAACASVCDARRLLLDVEGARPMTECLRQAPVTAGGPVALLVGPEGGLEPLEVQFALRAGFQTCTLGPRVLRTETAPLAALAVLQVLAGDFGTRPDS